MSQVAAGPTSCIPLPAAKIRPNTSVCRSRPATAMAQGPCKTSHPFRRPKKTKRTLMDAAKLVQNPNLPARQLSMTWEMEISQWWPWFQHHLHIFIPNYSYNLPSNTLPMEGPNMLKLSSNVSHRQPILKLAWTSEIYRIRDTECRQSELQPKCFPKPTWIHNVLLWTPML